MPRKKKLRFTNKKRKESQNEDQRKEEEEDMHLIMCEMEEEEDEDFIAEQEEEDEDDEDFEENQSRRKRKRKKEVTSRPRPLQTMVGRKRICLLPGTTSMPMIVPEDVIAEYNRNIPKEVDILLGREELILDLEVEGNEDDTSGAIMDSEFFQVKSEPIEIEEEELELEGDVKVEVDLEEPKDIEFAIEDDFTSINGVIPPEEPPLDTIQDRIIPSKFSRKKDWLKEMGRDMAKVIMEYSHVIGREPKEYHLFYLTIYRYLQVGLRKRFINSKEDILHLWKHYDDLGDRYFRSTPSIRRQLFQEEYDCSKSNYLEWYLRCRDWGDTKAYFFKSGRVSKEEMLPRNKKFYNLDAIWRHIVKLRKPEVGDLESRLEFLRYCTKMTDPKDVCRMSVLWLRLNKGLRGKVRKKKEATTTRRHHPSKYDGLTPEEKQMKIRNDRFLYWQARFANMSKEEREAFREKNRLKRRENYLKLTEEEKRQRVINFQKWKASLSEEKKRRHEESIRKALKKYHDKKRARGDYQTREYKGKLSEYWKRKVKEEAPEERARRLLRYKMNTRQRKERKEMEEQGGSQEEIEERMEEIRREMGWTPQGKRGRPKGVPRKQVTTPVSKSKSKKVTVPEVASTFAMTTSRNISCTSPVPKSIQVATSCPVITSRYICETPPVSESLQGPVPVVASACPVITSTSRNISIQPSNPVIPSISGSIPTSEEFSLIPQPQPVVLPTSLTLAPLQMVPLGSVPVSVIQCPPPAMIILPQPPEPRPQPLQLLQKFEEDDPTSMLPLPMLEIEIDNSFHDEDEDHDGEDFQLPENNQIEPVTPKINCDSSGKPLGPNMCDECGATFVRIYELRCHKADIHKTPGLDLSCPECGYPCKKSKTLWYHYSRYHLGPKKIDLYPEKVQSFFRNTPQRPKLRSRSEGPQKQNRGQDQPNQCPSCGKTFSQKASLDEHVRRVHQGQTYSCDLCGRNHQSAGKLWRHQVDAHELHDLPPPEGVTCVYCRYCQEPVMRGYETHVKKKHPEKLDEFQKSGENLKKVGGRPGYGIPGTGAGNVPEDIQKIMREMTLENKEELLRCPICQSKIRRRLLKRHWYDKHQAEHPCPDCGKVFGVGHKMIDHYWRKHAFDGIEHHLEKNGSLRMNSSAVLNSSDLSLDFTLAECLICPQEPGVKFSVRPEIRVHFIKCHPDIVKDYKRICKSNPDLKCENCEESFFSELQLRKHCEDVHPQRRYTCEHCGIFKKTEKERITHEKTHTTVGEVKRRGICTVCRFKVEGGDILDRDERLRGHVIQQHPEDYRNCGKCSFWTTDYKSLMNHMTGKHYVREKGKFYIEKTLCKMDVVCPKCPKILKMASVQDHLHNVHGIKEEAYQCTYCPMSLKQLPNYVAHVEIVHEVPLESLVQIPQEGYKPEEVESGRLGRRRKIETIRKIKQAKSKMTNASRSMKRTKKSKTPEVTTTLSPDKVNIRRSGRRKRKAVPVFLNAEDVIEEERTRKLLVKVTKLSNEDVQEYVKEEKGETDFDDDDDDGENTLVIKTESVDVEDDILE